MAHIRANLVQETTTTTGTGNYTAAGATSGNRAFSAVCVNTDTFPAVVRMDGSSDWEEGIYMWTTGNVIIRLLITGSSNAGAAVNWGAGTKTITLGEGPGNEKYKTFRLTADHTLASTTATEVTGLEAANLLPGVYKFKYTLLLRSSATATGIGLGINFTGTATMPNAIRYGVTTGTTTATGVFDDVSNNLTCAMVEGQAANAFTTTAPNMLNGGVATANSTFTNIVEGMLVVTATGNLELWHSSETAANTSVMTNSILELIRVA